MHSQIESLRKQQELGAVDQITALRMVEINPIEICNRSCYFCPRNDPEIYASSKSLISEDTVKKIALDLQEIDFSGRLGFVGFGEPLLHKKIEDLVYIIRSGVKNLRWLEINTNGDYLTSDKIKSLAAAGCTHLVVSMYDRDITKDLSEMRGDTDIEIIPRHCYIEKFELQLVNRTEILLKNKNLNIPRACYIPFYKMFIDWNGDVLVCSEDWGRSSYQGNVVNTSVREVWLGKEYSYYRKNLLQGLRKNCDPCKSCDVNGTKFGSESFEIFKKIP